MKPQGLARKLKWADGGLGGNKAIALLPEGESALRRALEEALARFEAALAQRE